MQQWPTETASGKICCRIRPPNDSHKDQRHGDTIPWPFPHQEQAERQSGHIEHAKSFCAALFAQRVRKAGKQDGETQQPNGKEDLPKRCRNEGGQRERHE